MQTAIILAAPARLLTAMSHCEACHHIIQTFTLQCMDLTGYALHCRRRCSRS